MQKKRTKTKKHTSVPDSPPLPPLSPSHLGILGSQMSPSIAMASSIPMATTTSEGDEIRQLWGAHSRLKKKADQLAAVVAGSTGHPPETTPPHSHCPTAPDSRITVTDQISELWAAHGRLTAKVADLVITVAKIMSPSPNPCTPDHTLNPKYQDQIKQDELLARSLIKKVSPLSSCDKISIARQVTRDGIMARRLSLFPDSPDE